jgi:hypothetical protein
MKLGTYVPFNHAVAAALLYSLLSIVEFPDCTPD